MKRAIALGMTSAALIAALAGCSTASKESESTGTSAPTSAEATSSRAEAPSTPSETPAAAPGTGKVSLDNADLGAVTGVTCQTESGAVTIALASSPPATVVVTDEETPSVTSVNIGELGGDTASVAFVAGVTGSEAKVVRTGSTYTVTGTGTGARTADPATPVNLPFEIAATCP